MAYIDLRGHQVWSNEFANNGEPLLSLHGGLSASHRWDWTILPAVEKQFHMYSYDRTAHGRTGVRPGFYHFEFQRDEAIAYIEDVIKEPTHMIGHSDGGIIPLMVAIARKAMEVWKCEPNLTTGDLAKITCPVLVMAGEEEPFSNHHTVDLYEALNDADLAIIPGATHSVMKDKPELALAVIRDFYSGLALRHSQEE